MAQEVRAVVWQSEGSRWISPWLCNQLHLQSNLPNTVCSTMEVHAEMKMNLDFAFSFEL